MKSQAAVFWGQGRPFEVAEIDLEEPGPGEVLVRMAAVGICGTDLHVIKGEWDRPKPMVLGHEGAGIVEAAGEGVEGVGPGDSVVLSWAPSCGECSDCRRGRPAACMALQRAIGGGTLLDGRTGLSLDGETVYRGTTTGAWAERVVVGEQVALPLGEGIPLEEAALLGCAALTGVGAADPDRGHADEDLAGTGLVQVDLRDLERPPLSPEDGRSRFHAFAVTPSASSTAAQSVTVDTFCSA